MTEAALRIRNKARFASGWRALPTVLRIFSGYAMFAIRKKAFPLFRVRASRGGIIGSNRVFRELKLGKLVRQGGGIRYCLTVPALGSRPYKTMAARGGLNINVAGTPLKAQIDHVILAVTRVCPFHCAHCYERHHLGRGEDVPQARWQEVIRELQSAGASIIVLSGGEPMARFETVRELLRSADKDRTEFHLHTSGHGVTPGRARDLQRAGLSAAAVGLDDVRAERHDLLRGFTGAFQEALAAIDHFREAGLFVYLNLCLSKELVRAGDLPAYMEMARELGVGAVRFLEPRPTGGYAGQDASQLFSDSDRTVVTDIYLRLNASRRGRHYPLISYEAYFEAPERLGCRMGGLSHLSIDSAGNVNPCVFVPVRFGNIREESFAAIYARMRALIPEPLRGACPSLSLAEAIGRASRSAKAFPIPIEDIRTEWEGLWTHAPGRTNR